MMKGVKFTDWKAEFIRTHPDMEIQTRRVQKDMEEINKEPDGWEFIKYQDKNIYEFTKSEELINNVYLDIKEILQMALLEKRKPSQILENLWSVKGW